MIFEESEAQLTDAECQKLPQDINAERQKDNNLSTSSHTVGLFSRPATCHKGILRFASWSPPGSVQRSARFEYALQTTIFAEESGPSSPTARNDYSTNSSSTTQY